MRVSASLFIAACCMPVPGRADTFDDLAAGRRCEQTQANETVCSFDVRDVLHLRVVGVGRPDARVEFLKSDIDGAYYASLGFDDQCIVVYPGHALRNRDVDSFFDRAFISPRSGEVYRELAACRSASAASP